MSTAAPTLTAGEQEQIDRANGSSKQTVVFVHGLWLLPSSWDPWVALFEEHGFTAIAPAWPGDAATVAEARLHPETFAGRSIGAIRDHLVAFVGALTQRPVVVGHSFGGLFVQQLAGLGLVKATVAIDPAPARGVLPLPISALKSAFPVLGKPKNRKGSVMLTAEQFRYAFTNAVSETEAATLYETFPVPGSGAPLFQAAFANINPRTEAAANTSRADRGPMLIISGEHDHTVPRAIANGAFKRQKKNAAVTEFIEIPGRGHSLVIDGGWPEVAQAALDFLARNP